MWSVLHRISNEAALANTSPIASRTVAFGHRVSTGTFFAVRSRLANPGCWLESVLPKSCLAQDSLAKPRWYHDETSRRTVSYEVWEDWAIGREGVKLMQCWAYVRSAVDRLANASNLREESLVSNQAMFTTQIARTGSEGAIFAVGFVRPSLNLPTSRRATWRQAVSLWDTTDGLGHDSDHRRRCTASGQRAGRVGRCASPHCSGRADRFRSVLFFFLLRGHEWQSEVAPCWRGWRAIIEGSETRRSTRHIGVNKASGPGAGGREAKPVISGRQSQGRPRVECRT